MSDMFSGGRADGGLAGNLPGGVKLAAIALLVHELMKHSRNQGAATPEGGGLGSILGGLFGGGAGAQPSAQAPGPWANQSGQAGGLGGLLTGGSGGLLAGLGGLLNALRGSGLGQQIDSWVAQGPNQPVLPQQLERGFDPQEIDEAARRAGTDRGTLLQELSAMLPQVVDRMTPQGRLPQREEDAGSGFGGLLSSLIEGDRTAGPQRR